jgi:hypothetical protein
MKNSTPNTKAIRSALVGLATAALVISIAVYGGTLTAALRGDGLQASQAARNSFALATSTTPTVLKAPRVTRTQPTQTTTQVAYRIAEPRSDDGESQED